MKIFKDKQVKIRKPDFTPADEETGRKCEQCGNLVPYGQKMRSVSAQPEKYIRGTYYFCNDCQHGNVEEMVKQALQRREDEIKAIMDNTPSL